MRVVDHPVLGPLATARMVRITVDGAPLTAREGETIAAAMLAAGLRVNRMTKKLNEPRGLFCGIGQCTDCVMVVNGVPNIRTCVTAVADGMTVQTQVGLEAAPDACR